MLALGRALGETMAVPRGRQFTPHLHLVIAPGTTISATIANEFTEASAALHGSLIELGQSFSWSRFWCSPRPNSCSTAGTPGRGAHVNRSRYLRRRIRNGVFLGLSVAATAFGLGWLGIILGTLLYEGFSGIDLALFTESTPPPGEMGGLSTP